MWRASLALLAHRLDEAEELSGEGARIGHHWIGRSRDSSMIIVLYLERAMRDACAIGRLPLGRGGRAARVRRPAAGYDVRSIRTARGRNSAATHVRPRSPTSGRTGARGDPWAFQTAETGSARPSHRTRA
jgi:hypothetical protein